LSEIIRVRSDGIAVPSRDTDGNVCYECWRQHPPFFDAICGAHCFVGGNAAYSPRAGATRSVERVIHMSVDEPEGFPLTHGSRRFRSFPASSLMLRRSPTIEHLRPQRTHGLKISTQSSASCESHGNSSSSSSSKFHLIRARRTDCGSVASAPIKVSESPVCCYQTSILWSWLLSVRRCLGTARSLSSVSR